MKKQKKTTGSSRTEKRETALIPLVSKKENNLDFITNVCAKADEIILLLIVDTAAMPGQFGFAASDISHGNQLMEEIKEIAKKKRTICNDLIEWGETIPKICNFAQLRKIKKIFLVKQQNEFFKKLVKELKEKTDAEIEIVEIAEQKV